MPRLACLFKILVVMTKSGSRDREDVYHAGEKAVQKMAGRQLEAEALSRMIAPTLSVPSARFLSGQSFVIASSVDSVGRVWASLLTGAPGFIEVVTAQNVFIHFPIIPASPLAESLEFVAALGLLVIDPANRTRLRLNGKCNQSSLTGIDLELQQVYFNCPMYIQRRSLQSLEASPKEDSGVLTMTDRLSHQQSQWISQADTFFIASLNLNSSDADASHRGGFPGFVKVINPNTIAFPDYSGNSMFNTLGNIHVNPQTGLIFVDFDEGSTLQITGKAKILWDREVVSLFLGAERVILIRVEHVLESSANGSMHWSFIDYSPYNPALQNAEVPHESEKIVPLLSEKIIQKMLSSLEL